MQKYSQERLRELLKQARAVHDDDTVKALSEKLFEETGVQEPEFAPVESSGNLTLDNLRKRLKEAIAVRDEDTEAALRVKIADEEAETLPEVVVEPTPEAEIPADMEFTEEEAELMDPVEAELTPFVAKDYDQGGTRSGSQDAPIQEPAIVLCSELFKDVLMATQIAALSKVKLGTESLLRVYLNSGPEDESDAWKLEQINGIGKSSAATILEVLANEV
jgi:hypothetical protein